jgi:hypothetical protein
MERRIEHPGFGPFQSQQEHPGQEQEGGENREQHHVLLLGRPSDSQWALRDRECRVTAIRSRPHHPSRASALHLDVFNAQPQPPGTCQQAHALAEQLVHGRVPSPRPLADRPNRLRWLWQLRRGRWAAPAGGVGDDGLLHRTAQVAPQVPAVTDLHRRRCSVPDGSGVGGRAVAADDLGARMGFQPRRQRGALRSGSTSVRRWLTASMITVA